MTLTVKIPSDIIYVDFYITAVQRQGSIQPVAWQARKRQNKSNDIICKIEVNNVFSYDKRSYTKSILDETEEYHTNNRPCRSFKNINCIRNGFKKQEKF